jgi:hypothetical protein
MAKLEWRCRDDAPARPSRDTWRARTLMAAWWLCSACQIGRQNGSGHLPVLGCANRCALLTKLARAETLFGVVKGRVAKGWPASGKFRGGTCLRNSH